MKPVTRTELKRFIGQLPKDQLVNQVLDLWTTLPEVKDYYEAKVRPQNDEGVREKYRKVILHEFFPPRGMGKLRLSVARKAVADYRKLGVPPEGVADLMLFYVETGVRFINEYGDITPAAYLSLARMYGSAVEWIVKHDLRASLGPRCARLVVDSRYIGYELHDVILDLTEQFLGLGPAEEGGEDAHW